LLGRFPSRSILLRASQWLAGLLGHHGREVCGVQEVRLRVTLLRASPDGFGRPGALNFCFGAQNGALFVFAWLILNVWAGKFFDLGGAGMPIFYQMCEISGKFMSAIDPVFRGCKKKCLARHVLTYESLNSCP
jgi:hypothetical protein